MAHTELEANGSFPWHDRARADAAALTAAGAAVARSVAGEAAQAGAVCEPIGCQVDEIRWLTSSAAAMTSCAKACSAEWSYRISGIESTRAAIGRPVESVMAAPMVAT